MEQNPRFYAWYVWFVPVFSPFVHSVIVYNRLVVYTCIMPVYKTLRIIINMISDAISAGMWSRRCLSLFWGPVCAPRVFPSASSQLVLAYLHLSGQTISCNCVATVIPLIWNVWSACAKCWLSSRRRQGAPGYQRHVNTKVPTAPPPLPTQPIW